MSQHGIVSRAQLIEIGLTRSRIQRAVGTGYLIRIYPGVYAVGHCALTVRSRWMAAVLVGGDQAVLSHGSAASAWGLCRPLRPVEVVRPGGRHSCPGLVIRRVNNLPEPDRGVVHGIPVTSPSRTLIDIAGRSSPRVLDDRISALRRLGLLGWDDLKDTLERNPRRKGSVELKSRIGLLMESSASTRSELETRFLRLCDENGLPRPEVDVALGSRIVDFLWRPQRLIAEVDGFRFHHHRFDEDRIRDLGHLVDGYRTVRVTYQMMESAPGRLVESLRVLLEGSGRRT